MEPQHNYLPSGWCTCGHHREDGRHERDEAPRLTRAEIRSLLSDLGPTYSPGERP